MGWTPFVDSWFEAKEKVPENKQLVVLLRKFFEKYVEACLEFRRKDCRQIVDVDPLAAVRSLCNLFDAVNTPENGVVPGEDDYPRMVEQWFVYSLVWSIGATVDEEGRKKMDMCLREIDAQFPSKGTVYDIYIDPVKRTWAQWSEKLNANWKPAPNEPFFKIQVPTVDFPL